MNYEKLEEEKVAGLGQSINPSTAYQSLQYPQGSGVKPNKLKILLNINKFKNRLIKSLKISEFNKLPSLFFEIVSDNSQLSEKLLQPIDTICPEQRFFIYWTMTALFFNVINLLFIPLQFSFQVTRQHNLAFQIVFHLLTSLSFFFDIVLTFQVSIFKQGKIVHDRKIIAKDYLKFQFWLDLIIFLPIIFEYFNPQFINFLVLLKLQKIKLQFQQIQAVGHYPYYYFEILKLLSTIVLFSHYVACGWHLLGRIEIYYDQTPWILYYGIQDEDWVVKYIWSIYWTVTVTVGYGDLVPVTNVERVYATCYSLYVSGIIIYSMGELGNIYTKINLKRANNIKQLDQICYYMRKRGLNEALQLQVRKNIEYQMELNDMEVDEQSQQLINHMQYDLKERVLTAMYMPHLNKVNLFKSNKFSEEFKKSLCLKVMEKKFTPEDLIFSRGEICTKFAFILSGKQKIDRKSWLETMKGQFKSKVNTQSNGQISSIKVNQKIKFWTKCDNYVNVGYVNQEDFNEIIQMYPSDRILYDNYLDEDLNCEVCQKPCHQLIKYSISCPFIFYKPEIQTLVKKEKEAGGREQSRVNLKRFQKKKRRII